MVNVPYVVKKLLGATKDCPLIFYLTIISYDHYLRSYYLLFDAFQNIQSVSNKLYKYINSRFFIKIVWTESKQQKLRNNKKRR